MCAVGEFGVPSREEEAERESFLEEVDRARKLTMQIVTTSITTDPDAYPFVLEMLNAVLLAGIEADTIGGSEPDTLRRIGRGIRRQLTSEDEASVKLITVV
jgi:isopropylmalate/homocitrate/citramalate synthase